MPPGVTTLGSIRAQVRQRADMVNSLFVAEDELTGYINASYFELYDLLITHFGENYAVAAPFSVVTDGTNDQYALPAAFYKLLGVDIQLDQSPQGWGTVKPFNFADRNRYTIPNTAVFYGMFVLRYRINGNNLWLTPLPTANQSLRIWYVPRLITLVSDSDTVDGVSGWEEYIIIDAAIKCLQKEESDVSVLMAQKQAMLQRVNDTAANRDVGSPATVVDSQSIGAGSNDGNGAPWGWSGWW